MTGLLSPAHIVLLLAVLLLMFGAKRLPELGRTLGSGLREFKDMLDGERNTRQATRAAVHDATAGTNAAAPPVS